MPADIIVVDGDPTKDVTVLGRPGAIKHVIKDGSIVDLETPLPERGPLPGWRVSQYSTHAATRSAVSLGNDGERPS